MKKAELVFIPFPGISHLGSTLEVAKLLADTDDQLSISVIIIKFPTDTKVSTLLKSLSTASRINFIELKPEPISIEIGPLFMRKFVESHKAQVRDVIAGISNSESVKLCGVVVDMFCTSMIDVANEFEVPSYVFFTSSAAMLGLWFHFQSLRDNFGKYVWEIEDSEAGLSIPCFQNHVPYGVLPMMFLSRELCDSSLDNGKRFRETKGIIINTFLELESHAVESLSTDETIPPVYTVGPILGLKSTSSTESPETEKIVKWLDLQPEKSVVFLCFGSRGHFGEAQVKEIAYALEGSGHKFLWSLRKPPPLGKFEGPSEYENFEEVLPEGFLQRTAGTGMVIGWAPQTAVLSHSSVGGFVSHCGWNSTLESIWFGVPVATWPLFAEQQMNAFELVKELGLAVEVKMDYKLDFMNQVANEIVRADVIEDKIKILMDPENGIREKVKEMKEKSRLALEEGGSSSASLKDFINGVIKQLP